MSLFQAILIAIIEGLTEFLPISSTGHMIIAQKLLGIEANAFNKAYIICIQFGAILSVVVLYWKRFFKSINFYYKLLIGFLPAAIIGFIFNDFIDQLLGSVLVVAIMLFLGGIVLVFIDDWVKEPKEPQEVSKKNALVIGFYQCIAMIPGVSRSASTIIGGLFEKLDRRTAAEFSFFLAVPTMFAATVFKLYDNYQAFNASNIHILIIGNIVAFLVAMLAIKFFINYLTKHGFRVFGYYRIIVGLLLLFFILSGIDMEIM